MAILVPEGMVTFLGGWGGAGAAGFTVGAGVAGAGVESCICDVDRGGGAAEAISELRAARWRGMVGFGFDAWRGASAGVDSSGAWEQAGGASGGSSPIYFWP